MGGADDSVAMIIRENAYAAYQDGAYAAGGACGPNAALGICNQLSQLNCVTQNNWTLGIDNMLRQDGAAQTDRFIRGQSDNSWSKYDEMQKIAVALLHRYVTPRSLYLACLYRYSPNSRR